MPTETGPPIRWKNEQDWDHHVRPERWLFRWTESHLVKDPVTGEPKPVTSDFGLIPGGAYVELRRLLWLAEVEVTEE